MKLSECYSPLDAGHEAILRAVLNVRAQREAPVVVVESLRQFGDVLHSTLVVRHIRKTEPNASVVWAIMEPFVEAFEGFTPAELGPHAIAPLPVVGPHPDDNPFRIAWVRHAGDLHGVVRAFGVGVGVWGWKRGTIVDAVLDNADIRSLAVERRPWLPTLASDEQFVTKFIGQHGLENGFVTLEFCSRTLPIDALQPEWFDVFVALVDMPVVALGAAGDGPLPRGAIDGRGTTFRQAKALIAWSSCFVGRGSGLSVLAAASGCEQPVVEVCGYEVSMVGIGYRAASPGRHRVVSAMSVGEVAHNVNELAGGPS